MTDRANIFADKETVGALFDALWYNATEAADARTKYRMAGGAPEDMDPEGFFRQAREMAIGDAHKRYLELTGKE